MSHEPEETYETGISYDCSDDVPCEQTWCDSKRRRFLGAIAAGATAGLAGCTGLLAAPDERPVRGAEDLFWLDFLREDQQVEGRGSKTVLRTAEEAGIEIPYFCRAGYCGVCLSRADGDANEVVDMSINDYDPLVSEAVEDGYFLPCTSQPRSDIAIQTHVDSDILDQYVDEEDPDDEPAREGIHDIEYVIEEALLHVPEDRDLLRTAEDAGLELPYQCREGFCGVCLSQADGDANELVEHTTNDFDPLDADAMEDGYLLTCTAQPRERFAVETGKEGDLD